MPNSTAETNPTCESCGDTIDDDEQSLTKRTAAVGGGKQTYHLTCYHGDEGDA